MALTRRPAGRRVSALPASLQRTDVLVELRGASVRLGGRTVLEAIDLAVLRGEHVALVGANGAGKTTLLRALHGLVPLASGRRETAAEPAARIPLRIAMVFQRPFMLRATLLANIELGLRLQGMSADARRERALCALEQVGLAAQASRPGRALSGGQQQRAALARAWALRPQLLLLDEPTASLDPSAKREVEDLIVGFGSQGITVVMSSHNLGQVKRLSRRVVYLEAGRVRADVDTDRFFHGELPPEAALFLKGELPWT